MKKTLIILIAILLSGCAEVNETDPAIQGAKLAKRINAQTYLYQRIEDLENEVLRLSKQDNELADNLVKVNKNLNQTIEYQNEIIKRQNQIMEYLINE
jgi:peptidoglycan hydrolase CwlO-like protein